MGERTSKLEYKIRRDAQLNIICDKTLLSAAIDGVSKAVTLRSTIPVLEGILLKAEGFQLNPKRSSTRCLPSSAWANETSG